MGYFDDCTPDQRFTSARGTYCYGKGGCLRTVHDWDQRRSIGVATSWKEEDECFIFEALMEHIDDDIPPDAIQVEVGREGEVIACSSDINEDMTINPLYPAVVDYGDDVPWIRRSDLVELDRLGLQVDLTILKSDLGDDSRRRVFKYYFTPNNTAVIWHEINCLMRIPKHPNIVPFDRLVIDTIDGHDKVVGYTTPFVPGGTVLDNVSRVFKLKYLRHLISAIDYLNLKLGIVHGDIVPYNLLINSATDILQVFDFNMASKLGWEEGDVQNNGTFGYEPDRSDVKYALFTLYEIITRDMHFREENYPHELDVSMVTNIEWEKHPDVCLDADVAEYRQLLEDWVDTRKYVDEELITHWSQAQDCIDWPMLPEFPPLPWIEGLTQRAAQMRQTMVRVGADFLKWQRPPSCELPLPEGQLLLATGQIVDAATGEVVGGGGAEELV